MKTLLLKVFENWEDHLKYPLIGPVGVHDWLVTSVSKKIALSNYVYGVDCHLTKLSITSGAFILLETAWTGQIFGNFPDRSRIK